MLKSIHKRIATTLLVATACMVGAPGEATAAIDAKEQVDYAQWSLPTGSTIAYRKFSGAEGANREPVIFLHGGPGAHVLTLDQTMSMLERLAQGGYDVFAYDQVGGGLSERLEDIREYTVARHVADLDAIRHAIGAERVILLGSSWGATLAVHYAATHPDRVAKLIVSGPGVIHLGDWTSSGYGKIDERMSDAERAALQEFLGSQPNLERALEALATDTAKALEVLPDAEGGRIFDEATNSFYLPHLGCPGTKLSARSNGYGFWANRMIGRDLEKTEDPKPVLRRLDIPTLVLRGSCEYMKAAVAQQYRDVFDGRFVEIQGAGHMIWWEQPEQFLSVVQEFLGN